MKKFIYSAMAVAMLATTSCTDDILNLGEEASVEFCISTPQIETRAYSDGTKAKHLQYAVYEANDANTLTQVTGELTNFDGNETISLTLKTGKDYKVVFWAAAENAPYEVNFAEKTMIVDYENARCNDDSRDAFYGVADVNVTTNRSVAVELRRPFAQLNIGTNDFAESIASNYVPTHSAVTVKGLSNKLDLLYGTVSSEDNDVNDVRFGYNAIPSNDPQASTGREVFPIDGYDYLAMTYVLVGDQDAETMDIEFEFTNGTTAEKRTVGSVPFRRNYRTNIYGSLLTSEANVEVEIKPDFGGDENLQMGVKIGDTCYKTFAEAYAAAQNGDELVVVGNLLLTEQYVIEKDITLNLNGNEVITLYDSDTKKHLYAFKVASGNKMTIKDSAASRGSNGVIKARGIYNYGTLTLESGTIDACDGNGGYGVYNFGTFVMNGGEVKASNEDDNLVDKGGYDATPIRNEEGGKVTINGGKINNICDYTFAIDNQKGGEVIVNKGEITSIHSTVSTYGTMTINGGSFTCNGLEGVTAHALVVWNGSTTTIYGGTFDGKDNYNGFNVDAVAGATVYIKGGEFRPVHSGSLYGEGTIVVSGGIFFDKVADDRLAEGCTLSQLKDGRWKAEGKGWYQDANGNYHIEGAKGWLWMADQNDTFFGSKTIYLDNDIDFSGVDMRVTRMWTPEYSATFDGQNHTVSNIWMASDYNSNNQALFDGLMSVKNLNVDRASVFGMSQVGIIGANIFGNIENCHVTNSRSYGYVCHVGGIVGLHSWGEIKNCSIEKTSIECYYYGAVGAIAGAMNEMSRKITGCSVKGCKLIKEGPEGVYPDWDPRFGIAVGYAYALGTYVFNVEIENNTIKGVASEQMYGEVAADSTVTVNGTQK